MQEIFSPDLSSELPKVAHACLTDGTLGAPDEVLYFAAARYIGKGVYSPHLSSKISVKDVSLRWHLAT